MSWSDTYEALQIITLKSDKHQWLASIKEKEEEASPHILASVAK